MGFSQRPQSTRRSCTKFLSALEHVALNAGGSTIQQIDKSTAIGFSQRAQSTRRSCTKFLSTLKHVALNAGGSTIQQIDKSTGIGFSQRSCGRKINSNCELEIYVKRSSATVKKVLSGYKSCIDHTIRSSFAYSLLSTLDFLISTARAIV